MEFLIWSEEHQAWWRANSCGYTTSIRQAGRYPEEEAKRIVFNANGGDLPRTFCEVAFAVPDEFDAWLERPTHR